jgi:hypothetical protein
MGLNTFESLVTQDDPNDFQEALINASLLYSRAALTPDPVEKLLHVCVALERILIRNKTEPIQDNLAMRMAWLSGHDSNARQRNSSIVKAAYGIRSGYMHHGQPVDDLQTVEEFLGIASIVLRNLTANAARFPTRAEFIEVLDKKRFGT